MNEAKQAKIATLLNRLRTRNLWGSIQKLIAKSIQEEQMECEYTFDDMVSVTETQIVISLLREHGYVIDFLELDGTKTISIDWS